MNRGLVNELRNSLADVISREKAYNVPALCARLGLDAGDESEAMRSKFRYASARLASLAADRLVAIAKLMLEEEHDFGLAELVAKVFEAGTPAVTELTRRRLLAGFDSEPLSTEYDEIEFLETIWPIAAMPGNQNNVSFDDIGFRSLKDDIFQHTRRNDDWTNRELLERLGLMTASRALLFRFLEESVHPTAIDDDLQKVRVERINSHLQHDGYRLVRTGSISGSAVFKVVAHVIGSPADAAISSALQRFDPEFIHGRWTAALDRRANDPAGAITLARTLLEDVCRWLLDELGEAASDQDDLPMLYRKPRRSSSPPTITANRCSSRSSAAVSQWWNRLARCATSSATRMAAGASVPSPPRDTPSWRSTSPARWRPSWSRHGKRD